MYVTQGQGIAQQLLPPNRCYPAASKTCKDMVSAGSDSSKSPPKERISEERCEKLGMEQ